MAKHVFDLFSNSKNAVASDHFRHFYQRFPRRFFRQNRPYSMSFSLGSILEISLQSLKWDGAFHCRAQKKNLHTEKSNFGSVRKKEIEREKREWREEKENREPRTKERRRERENKNETTQHAEKN